MDYLLNLRIVTPYLLPKFIVLNLIINGLPSKRIKMEKICKYCSNYVLNLIINGLPSKLRNIHKRIN